MNYMNKGIKFLTISLLAFAAGAVFSNFAMSDVPSKIAVVDVQQVVNSSSQVQALKKEQEALGNASLKVIQENEEILEVVPADIDFEIDIASVESDVFNYGRSSNVIKNNIDII